MDSVLVQISHTIFNFAWCVFIDFQIHRNIHLQTGSRTESISARFFSTENCPKFQICHIDRKYFAKKNIGIEVSAHKAKLQKERKMTKTVSRSGDFDAFIGGIPSYWSGYVVVAEVNQKENQILVTIHRSLCQELRRELSLKHVVDLAQMSKMKEVLSADVQLLHSQMPLTASVDCTHGKLLRKRKLIDVVAYMEEKRTSVPVVNTICHRESMESYIATFGCLIFALTATPDGLPLAVVCKSMLFIADLDKTMRSALPIAVWCNWQNKWQSICQSGVGEWWRSVSPQTSATMQLEAQKYLQTLQIRSLMVNDRIHANQVIVQIARALPKSQRSSFIQEGITMIQSSTTSQALQRLRQFLKNWGRNQFIAVKMRIFRDRYSLKRLCNWHIHVEPDKIYRALCADHSLDVEHQHHSIIHLMDRTQRSVVDALLQLQGQQNMLFKQLYSAEFRAEKRPDITALKEQRLQSREDRKTKSSFNKGRMDKGGGKTSFKKVSQNYNV